MVKIIGDGVIQAAKAFYDVSDSLDFGVDIYLGAMWANPLGIYLSDVVIYNMEPLYDGCQVFEKFSYLDTLKRCKVLDYSRNNIAYLRAHGVDAFYLPYGMHDSLKRINQKEKDIDVLFFGTITERRRPVIDELAKECNLICAYGVYGLELDDLVSRSKVHLNLHHCDNSPLEVVRLNYLIANGCTVVSERGNDCLVNDLYESAVIFSEYSNLTDLCLSSLNNERSYMNNIPEMNCNAANIWIMQ